ncbi:MAG: DNA topoisomerase IV subunit A [Betaproteobacteria bacterium]|nr:DNA topoisomerase IV subunit A [Betaproteobacteria bacterium]
MDDTNTPDLFSTDAGDDAAPIEQHASQAYLGYAVSTVKARALPEIADGLKPVQRRILYAMGDTGAEGYAKCARFVGEVLGKYHPHGDSSTYEAMVHMAQPFSMRYPLIDGQGNFGSRDGDSAAAYRYTEAKLSRYAELMLAEIGEGTVDFIKNYDGKFDEPQLLPARMPFGLLNGSFGIPVGFSTRIPPHNLREVALAAALVLKNPKATVDEVLEVLPGPDFPGGAQIISNAAEIRQAYETGRGSIAMRARWHVEPLARGQWRIVVDELPHGVSCRQVLEEIEALVNPKPTFGKKDVTQEQKRIKQFVLDIVETVRDESDRKSRMRIIIEPRSSRQNVDEMMKALLVHTSLETRYPLNFTWLGFRDGLPDTKGILAILTEWTEFRTATVRRRTQFRLDKCESRLHIVEGRIMAFVHIDEIIKLIRSCEDQAEAKRKLSERWGFSERQAEDIVNLRLGQLTRLDGVKLNDEKKALEKEKDEYRRILDSERVLKNLVVKELEDDAKKYGDARRTLIRADERTSLERAVVEEPVTVILSKKGWIRARVGHGIDLTTVSFKDGDGLSQAAECKTTDQVVFLGSSGKTWTLEAAGLPSGRGDGAPVNSLVNAAGDTIVWMGTGSMEQSLLLHTTSGHGFVAQLKDMVTRMKAGKEFMKPAEGAKVLPPAPVPGFKGDVSPRVAALSSDGRLLVFLLDEMPLRPNGGLGVQLIALPEKVTLASVVVIDGTRLELFGMKRGKRSSVELGKKEIRDYDGRRAQRGRVADVGLKDVDRLGG